MAGVATNSHAAANHTDRTRMMPPTRYLKLGRQYTSKWSRHTTTVFHPSGRRSVHVQNQAAAEPPANRGTCPDRVDWLRSLRRGAAATTGVSPARGDDCRHSACDP